MDTMLPAPDDFDDFDDEIEYYFSHENDFSATTDYGLDSLFEVDEDPSLFEDDDLEW